jgi:hypothetical protein
MKNARSQEIQSLYAFIAPLALVYVCISSTACMPTLISGNGTSVPVVLTSPVPSSEVLSGESYYDINHILQNGTMTNHGNWNINTTPFPGSGYYSGVSSSINAANVCTGTNIFGASGSAVCENGATSSPASAANILSGLEAWNSAGAKMTGTLPNQGTFNEQNAFPGAGFYTGNTANVPTSSEILSGDMILGVTGTYTGTFAANAASNALRDAGSTVIPQLAGQTTSHQITLQTETATYGTTSLPTGSGYNYRDIPDMTKDDEEYLGTTCNFAPRPSNSCGTTQTTVALRIANCAAQNPTTSTWNGASQCSRGQATWSLVTRDGANKEVWQDNRTGLLWSSLVSAGLNWCQASGNTQLAPVTFTQAYNNSAGTAITGNGSVGSISGGSSSLGETITIKFTGATAFTVTSTGNGCGAGSQTGALTTTAGSTATWSRTNYCSFTLTQGTTNWAANDTMIITSVAAATYSCAAGAASGLQPSSPMSYCAEADGAFTNYPAGENWASGSYMSAKGLMGENSTPAVRWRLATREDDEQASVDGIRMVMPDMGTSGGTRPNIDGSAGGSSYEWTATLWSQNRSNAIEYSGNNGYSTNATLTTLYPVRCVGRW